MVRSASAKLCGIYFRAVTLSRQGNLQVGPHLTMSLLLRKEVIQPLVPQRLPCYDFILVTGHTFGTFLLIRWVRSATSGTADFHDVTGGVYKARERIQAVS